MLSMAPNAKAQPDWTEQGPGPAASSFYGQVSGAIEAIAADPTDANRVFVAAVNGGVWRTLNATATTPTWTPLTDHLPSLSMGSIALSPLNANTVFGGFGRFSSAGGDGVPASGIIRSTDGGNTWTILAQDTFSGLAIRRVLPATFNDTGTGELVVLVAAVGPGGGVFRSVDGGDTFSLVLGGSSGASHVAPDPSDPQRFFAGIPASGIFMSENGGVNWTAINGNLPNPGAARIELSVSAAPDTNTAHNPVYVIVANFSPSATRVFRSADLGTTWTQLGPPPAFNTGGQAALHMSILADRSNPNVLFLGEDRGPFWRWDSTGSKFCDNGDFPSCTTDADCQNPPPPGECTLWRPMAKSATNNTIEHVDSRDAIFDPNGDILESDDGGIYRLMDPNNGANNRRWVPVIGNIRVTEFYSVAYDSVNHIFLGAAQDNGVPEQASKDGLLSQLNENEGGDGTGVATDNVSSPGHSLHYAAVQFLPLGPFYRRTFDSSNGLLSTATVQTRINGTGGKFLFQVDPCGGFQFFTPFVLNHVDPSKMLISLCGFLYESTSALAGDDLNSVGGVAATTNGFMPLNPIGDVAGWAYGGVSAGIPNPEVLYFGSESTLRVRTSGNGLPGVGGTYPGGPVKGIALNPTDWHRGYILDDGGRVWRTTDAGATAAGWLELTGNLPTLGTDLRTIETVGGAVVVAGTGGVFFASNLASGAGTVWRELGTNFPKGVVVRDVHYDSADKILLAGTLGRGAWKLDAVGADLVMTKTDTPDPVVTGGQLAYDIGVTNNGPSVAGNVTVTDAFPSTLTVASVSPGCSVAAHTVTCNLGNLANGASANVRLVGAVSCFVANGTLFNNTATASSFTVDPGPGENSATAITTASNPPPAITCPSNIVRANDPGLFSAVVTYSAPTVTDNCAGATVACSPASGSTFQKGTTPVTCTASDSGDATARCGFTVTVNTGDQGDIQCCLTVGDEAECDETTPDECQAEGGTNMGAGSCVPNPCPTISTEEVVCCIPDPDEDGPECEETTAGDCAAAQGVNLGTGSCDPNPCAPTPPPDEEIRCCVADDDGAECEEGTADECTALNGINLGAGSCDPNPCAPTPPPDEEIRCCVADDDGAECEGDACQREEAKGDN